jgi:large subunit ribosomal protein L18
MMSVKIKTRLRRTTKTRFKIKSLGVNRLCVHKTANHIYAQVIDATGGKVLASASTLDKEIRANVKHGGNKSAASLVGKTIGARATQAGIKNVAFDRSGFPYHGRIKSLAEAAREAGLEF